MRKQIIVSALISAILMLTLATTASAVPANILLRAPANNAEITTFTQDFIYSFDQTISLFNCSLIVDETTVGFRNGIIVQNNNKITVELKDGTHEWYIKCYDSEFQEIISEKRTVKVNAAGIITQGYETIYNSNGLRSYAITISPGQSPVTLPAMKSGEDIQIKLDGKTHYIDIIKMGASGSTSFVEVRDRTSGKIQRMLMPIGINLDFNNDEIIDIELYLQNVERNVNAYFIVTPYPGTAPAEEPQQPANQTAENNTDTTPPADTPATETPNEEQEEQTPIVGNDKDEHGCIGSAGYSWCEAKQKCLRTWEEECTENGTSATGKKSLLLPILIVIAAVLLIMLLIVAISKNKRKNNYVHTKKTETKLAESKSNKLEEDKELLGDETHHDNADNEKFDIVRSAGRNKRK